MISSSCRSALFKVISWLTLGVTAAAANPRVEVRSPGAKILETAPGHIITTSVIVENHGAQAEEFSDELLLPAGCQRVAPPELPFSLGPGGQSVRLLAISVAEDMPAGRSTLQYTVKSRHDPYSTSALEFSLQTSPVDGLELIIDPAPESVIAGDRYSVRLHIANRGNSRLDIQLTPKSTLGFPIRCKVSSFALEAGAVRDLLCEVETDRALAVRSSHTASFTATANSSSGKSLSACQASVVNVIPLMSGNRDPFHHLPMELKVLAMAESGHENQAQVELSGAGTLDEKGQNRIDFLFRGPDIQNSSLFGERDEYGASYHTEHWDLDLGDRTYSLSALTEKSGVGRGAGAHYHSGPTGAGIFYMGSRYRTQNSEEVGAYVRQELGQELSLQANFLRKQDDEALHNGATQNLFTLSSQYRRGKLLELQLEAGVSHNDAGGSDFAYRAEAHGELGQLTYALEHVHAGPKFDGYYSQNETTYASISKALTPKFRLHASLNRYGGNVALNDVRSSVVNRENSWSIGANFTPSKASEFSLDCHHTAREDILLPAAYAFRENAIRLGASEHFGPLQMQSFLDLGTLENDITAQSGPFQRYGAVLHWSPSPSQTYSVFGNYGPSAFSASSEKSLNFGVSARWQFSEHCAANLSYARNQFDGLTGHEQDQALASVRYQFEDKSALSIIGRWARATTKSAMKQSSDEAALLVSYSIPFSLGVSRKRSVGSLEGCVKNQVSGQGLPRVVFQIGEQFAVSDADGRFLFPALKPGKAELKVVQDSLGPHMAMLTALPRPILIRPAEPTHVDLSASPACSVKIFATRFAWSGGPFSSSALEEAGGMTGMIVELSNGRDLWRAQTDRTGCASFERLPEGRWKLRVAGELPPLYSVEEPDRFFLLKPAESKTVAIRVLPERKVIRLIDGGTLR